MESIKDRLSELFGLNYEEIKAESRKSWQQLNPEIIIDEDTWKEIWFEIEQIFKEYTENGTLSDDEFVITFCQTVDHWSPTED